MSFLPELADRLRANTPPFFKTLIKVFGAIAGLGAVIAVMDAASQLPSWFNADWYKSMILVGGVGAFVSKLPVNWNETSPNDVPSVPPPAAVTIVKDATGLPPDESQTP